MEKKMDLIESNEILDLFSNMQTINMSGVVDNITKNHFSKAGELKNNEMCFYRIKQLSFDEDYPHREAFENVLLSLDNEAFNFIYILTGTEEGIDLDIGVVANQNENLPVLGKKLSAINYGEIVANVFEGNFSGSKLEKLTGDKLREITITSSQKYKNAGVIIGIPSINEKQSSKDYDFQGIDRLINSMLGVEWRLVVVCEPVSKREILEVRGDIYELYNRLSVYSKRTFQNSVNGGETISFGKNVSDSSGENWGYSRSDSTTRGKQSETRNSSDTHQEANSEGKSRDHSEGKNNSFSMNRGSSSSITVEIANKHAEEIMKYINEELLERLKIGFSKGLFKSSIYYMAKEPTHANRLKVGIMSLFQGNKSTYSPLYAQKIDLNNGDNFDILTTYQNQYIKSRDYSRDALMLLGRPFYGEYIGLNTYLTTEEISLISGLPQKEVPGLSLKEGVSFGLNERNINNEDTINLGWMVQKGRDLPQIPFLLARESMAKHTFIAGVTGSGKTTTCHRLLSEANMPFLVIEPAKTEYRTLINSEHYKDLIVFTLGNEMVAPFRINPFELIPGEIISAHVDMVKATFTSAFPMEASMPQILEEAIYKCYQKKGWNIDTNKNEKYGEKAFNSEINSFPIMSDLLEEMKSVVESKHFSAQMQADYIGSLVSRLSNLTVGSKGKMLNCEHSTDFQSILNNNVIIEMEELKSPEDKALFMGFILSKMSSVIKDEHGKNNDFKHITLIEEAHRLFSKVEYGDSGSKKAAVETFTDLLAEVRKYGEGLIIVDQIPNKLASEVLKNTNTKIIHKILAKDDKEAVGDTMLMNDKQKEYLSALTVGNAIVFTENTDKPIHVHITAISNTNEEQVKDQIVKQRFEKNKKKFGVCYKDEYIMALYNDFDVLAKQLSHCIVNRESCQYFRNSVKDVSGKFNIEQKEIWRKLIKKRELLTGKATGSSFNEETRIQELVNFFTNIFSEDSFSDDDIEKSIFTYLM